MAGLPDLAHFTIERADFDAYVPGDAYGAHTEFLIDSTAGTFGTDLAGHDAESIRAARAWGAGVLSRLLVTALPHIDAERLGHDCREWDSDGKAAHVCKVGGYRLALDDDEDGPTLVLTVQTINADTWLARVGSWLQAINDGR